MKDGLLLENDKNKKEFQKLGEALYKAAKKLDKAINGNK